jgi:rhodanese-related sulfurtransferase
VRKALVLFIILVAITACNQAKKVSIQNINQEEFAKLNTEQIQLLDVRTPDEVNKGIIKGAITANFYDKDFAKHAASKFDKEKPLYIYCAAGGRSSKASSQMVLEGFNEVYNLQGGYRDWKEKN